MSRYFVPIILIGIAITFFFMVTNPMYNDINALKLSGASYDTALSTSKTLESERDQLVAKYNTIDPDNLDKLQKLLPDNVNSIRLILEIGEIASPYGMVLSNVKYDTSSTATAATTSPVVGGGATATASSQDYGTFNLEFSTSGTYDDFINFTKDLESNLRIVDISSVSFSSDTSASASTGTKKNSPEVYNYDFKVKTYWLKS
jgi:Tfp pilus assembly protein PilO